MRLRYPCSISVALGGVLVAGSALVADGTKFSHFTPLTSSAGPTADEAMPITFGNPLFEQRSIADRASQLAAGVPNSGSWDMITTNQTGPHKGRYLFTVFETGQSGVQRYDRVSGQADTIWQSPTAGAHVAFDASYCTVGDVHHRRRIVGNGGRRVDLAVRSPVRAPQPARRTGHSQPGHLCE